MIREAIYAAWWFWSMQFEVIDRILYKALFPDLQVVETHPLAMEYRFSGKLVYIQADGMGVLLIDWALDLLLMLAFAWLLDIRANKKQSKLIDQ